tara:strand:- start:75 stop:401 length:327 start_codon:yes stop_codon:yes gene_type:complete
MKTKKLISKVNRYLVLSKEFEQDVDILFEDRAVDATSMCITTTGTSISVSNGSFITNTTSNITTEAKTRAEVILEKAQSEANRSDRYDEYKKLQETLSKYFRFYIEEL